jgi:hypothetical protein
MPIRHHARAVWTSLRQSAQLEPRFRALGISLYLKMAAMLSIPPAAGRHTSIRVGPHRKKGRSERQAQKRQQEDGK